MGRIKDTQEQIKKKLSLGDYKTDMGCAITGEEIKSSMTVSQHDSLPVSQLTSKKKMTFYLDKESDMKLNEMFSRKLMKNEKVDKSTLISKAIDLLWKEDKEYVI